MRKADAWIMSKMDSLVLLLWNRFEIRKTELEQIGLALWLGGQVLRLIFTRHLSMPISDWSMTLIGVALLSAFSTLRWRHEKSMSVDLINTLVYMRRNDRGMIGLRWFVHCFTATFLALAFVPLHRREQIFEIVWPLGYWLNIIVHDAFTPPNPPKRTIKEKKPLFAGTLQPLRITTR